MIYWLHSSKLTGSCINVLNYSRSSQNDVLITQIDVFEEGAATDNEEQEVEGVDLQSHEAVFRLVYEKVYSID